MTRKCDWLQTRRDIVGVDEFTVEPGDVMQECLRPEGHAGPHLIKRLDQVGGDYVIWEKDVCGYGTCEDCWGEDPNDECLVCGTVSLEEAQRYLDELEYEG